MNRIVLCLLLGGWTVAPPDDDRAAGPATGEQVLPCVAAGETAPLEGEQAESAPGSVPCEEQDTETAPGDEPPTAEALAGTEAGPESDGEADSIAEASVEEEFTPGDEISEDYPVPLPSDI